VPGGAVGTPFTYPYDAHGNMTSMPHLTTMDWDFHDQLRHTAVSASGSITQESWYVYDAGGQRVRKVVQKSNMTEERLYFGNIEIFRRTRGGALELERETLHVTDDTRRIAMVDTPTVKPAGSKETELTRYQYSNHLGTACLELDDAAQIISYEEYYPFGSTSYQGTDQSREIPAKRYRYTGKERDEETGLYYHGARYYAPWLARWTAPDPSGMSDGPNLYYYVSDNPISFVDKTGNQGTGAAGDDPPLPPGNNEAMKQKLQHTINAAQRNIEAIETESAPLRKEQVELVETLHAMDPKDPKLQEERDKLQAQIDANAKQLNLLTARSERETNVIAESKAILAKIVEQEEASKLEPTTLGIDLQTGGSAVGIGSHTGTKGSWDAFQVTLLPRNWEVVPLYKDAKLDIALLKELAPQLQVQRQPRDTGGGLETHTTLGATVDVFNISSDPKGIEGALTLSAGYDFTGKNVAITGVLGAKYTLAENARLPILGRFGTNKVRLYAGFGVEGDIPTAKDAPSGFGGVSVGGGVLIEWNPLEKKKK
jgi:RHS repeat-associated protein